ncbi:MAG: molybdenum cofactor biosynthesis protein MoaE [Leptospiraceae bacterium]|nr:molybdenum cofactor biosynthesis protein MoaE [Leptospiraceae bacterium]
MNIKSDKHAHVITKSPPDGRVNTSRQSITAALLVRLSPDALDLNELMNAAAGNPASGGLVIFSGNVRNFNQGKTVSHLEYESYAPLAEKMMRTILEAAAENWSLHFAGVVHRTGIVAIGEPAVYVVTASAHRRAAYEANAHIIHRTKHEVPIWKKECYTDGTYLWGHNCDH